MSKDEILNISKSNSKNTIKNLEIEFEALKRETEKLFEELKITPEKLQEFQEPSNFTEKEWDQIQKDKASLQEKLHNELENYVDPKKTEDGFEELRNSSNWARI
jgi:hypothetical protein